MKSLATSLQDLSTQFRSVQNAYLKQIQSREERSKIYFEDPRFDIDMMLPDAEEIDDFFVKSNQATQQQLLFIEEENTKHIQHRDQEVNAIIRSIYDLNSIFKDLSQMVVDQGTVLDRIDYNVEQTHLNIYEGFRQLQKADSYQRKNRKMCVIIILAVAVIVLVFVLIVVKS